MTPRPPHTQGQALRRELGVFGATMMGLGSIIGSGVFLSIGLAAGAAGPAVILAIALAALVAMCNALSSAQLAANHPVSGGSYEYGYRYLHPTLGFTAGWMFLCAKSASAATAALGFAGYLLRVLGQGQGQDQSRWLPVLAVAAVIAVTLLVVSGLRRSNITNIIIVSITLLSLLLFIAAGIPTLLDNAMRNFQPFFATPENGSWSKSQGLTHASALMFVAYTGYGRIATLGEEVKHPRQTIPRAIIATLIVSATVYLAVAIISMGTIGAPALSNATHVQAAPLEVVARSFDMPLIPRLVAIGAITAMLGVLLNLILGLSRVLLAMARRGDMPRVTAHLNPSTSTPDVAVVVVGLIVASLAAIGSIKIAWSFSAFTVLIYYAITNLAALRLKPKDRLYSPIFAACGLAACAFLAFQVDWLIWLTGLGLIALGLIWHTLARKISPNTNHP